MKGLRLEKGCDHGARGCEFLREDFAAMALLCPDCGGWWSYPRAKTHRTGYRSFSFTEKIILKIV